MKTILILLVVALPFSAYSQSREVPFTLDDRDRLIKLESDVASLRNDMNTSIASLRNDMNSLRNEMMTRFDSQQRQIDDLKTMFYWGFGILISFMMFLLGFIIWDRRTALEPLRLATQAVSEQSKSFLAVLREFAREQPRLQELLKTHGLL